MHPRRTRLPEQRGAVQVLWATRRLGSFIFLRTVLGNAIEDRKEQNPMHGNRIKLDPSLLPALRVCSLFERPGLHFAGYGRRDLHFFYCTK